MPAQRMPPAAEVISAFAAGRARDAAILVFEYMAATVAEETGRPPPARLGELPAALQRECQNLAAVYRPPGTLLIACAGRQAIGCVGLAPHAAQDTAEVKRLYVRAAHRGQGTARALMSHAHQHAARHGIRRLVLDVLPARSHVVSFYRRLGYTGTEPDGAGGPGPMVCMQRLIGDRDLPGLSRE